MAAFRSLLIALLALIPLGIAREAFAQSAVPIVATSCGTQTLTATRNASPYETTTGNLCVNASVSASVSSFQPSASGARMTQLSVTTSDSSGTLPTGAQNLVFNTDTTNPIYCNENGVAATTSDAKIPANSWLEFTPATSVTTLHCIATGGTVLANGVGGAGLATGSGGGGGSGGGSSSFGTNIAAVVSASAAASSVVLKASAGGLVTVYVNPTLSGWLYVINATSKPADGAITAGVAAGNYQDCVPAAAGVGTSISYIGSPETFSSGITAEFSSTACGTLTASAVALLHGQIQ